MMQQNGFHLFFATIITQHESCRSNKLKMIMYVLLLKKSGFLKSQLAKNAENICVSLLQGKCMAASCLCYSLVATASGTKSVSSTLQLQDSMIPHGSPHHMCVPTHAHAIVC